MGNGSTRSWTVTSALLALAAVALTACSSTLAGQGSDGSPGNSDGPSGGSGAAGSGPSRPDFPSGSSTPAGSGTTTAPASSPTVASSTPTYQVVTVQGTSGGGTITARVYAQDRISGCAEHAYGAVMIRFLHAHRCSGAKRVLATTEVGGRTVVLSAISTGFPGTAADPYGVAAQFAKLEQADGTGSINDLLREGHSIPGLATRIPSHEVFRVLGQDIGVTVFDAWYARGRTDDHDRALRDLEEELFLTSLTAN